MAVVAHTRVRGATREQMHALDDAVGAAIMSTGAPPEGLMAVIVYPEGDGFVICDVWRDEAEMLAFHGTTQRPAIAELGLNADATDVAPVWTFARP